MVHAVASRQETGSSQQEKIEVLKVVGSKSKLYSLISGGEDGDDDIFVVNKNRTRCF